MRNYERLTIEAFGNQLLESGDLDPVYIMLHKAEMEPERMYRWLIAYWCLYHVGAACYISEAEGREFWQLLRTAAENEQASPLGDRWPRGSERRHWRGLAARKAVRDLMGKYLTVPGDMVRQIAELPDLDTTIPYKTVASRVKQHASFGDWMSFKIADMIDRLGIADVSFDNAAVFMFDDPRKAALKMFRLRGGIPEEATIKDEAKAINMVVDYLIEHFENYMAPPLYDRPVGLQEVETILCKWKSHMNGHYPLNNDLIEIREGAEPWAKVSKTADELLSYLPLSH
jgi:hypothetical protein